MRKAIIIASLLGGCVTAQQPPSFITRILTKNEKSALQAQLSQSLNDPGAAQFKWLPVDTAKSDTPMEAPIGYCGLVNGKNLYGGYVGYRPFYAELTRDAKGEYINGVIKHISGPPVTLFGDDTMSEAVETGLTEGSCRAWGYANFGAAQE